MTAPTDPKGDKLLQLSDEVNRIAATLAHLSHGAQAAEAELWKSPEGGVPDVSLQTIRSVIRSRRLRSAYFPEDLFADPAWDMLLHLFEAEVAQFRVPVSSLCDKAAVPATTALRWMNKMTDNGMFVRRVDPNDARRVFVELSGESSNALRRYFAARASEAPLKQNAAA